jgi:hypothetical protein
MSRGWIPVQDSGITPRPGDGRISRADAAKLAKVDADTVSAWISRGKLTDIRREGRRVWLNPVEVIEVEYSAHARERARMAKVLGVSA